MQKRKIMLSALIAVVVIQLGVPLSMIIKREIALKNGRQFKFKTAPVDPYDAFRGRYVALGMEQNKVKSDSNEGWEKGQRVYVLLNENPEGFAELAGITREKPKSDNFIKVRVRYSYQGEVQINLPFDRFYMNEKDAPKAETAYRKHSSREQRDAYVTVRVLDGFAVLEDLYVGGVPVSDFLKNEKDQN